MEKEYKSLKEFYPYYLTEHSNISCKIFHFVGTTLVFLLLISAIITTNWFLLLFIPISGYGFSWIGHFLFEKNKPAAFKYPLYSLASDFIMYFELLSGKLTFKTIINNQN